MLLYHLYPEGFAGNVWKRILQIVFIEFTTHGLILLMYSKNTLVFGKFRAEAEQQRKPALEYIASKCLERCNYTWKPYVFKKTIQCCDESRVKRLLQGGMTTLQRTVQFNRKSTYKSIQPHLSNHSIARINLFHCMNRFIRSLVPIHSTANYDRLKIHEKNQQWFVVKYQIKKIRYS